jgi:perosamine synthetase
VAGPSITEREVQAVAEATRSAWYEGAGLVNDAFEAEFAAHTARRFAASLPSCTSALHLALAALAIGPGDQVIVPESTWIATSAPVTYVGATPIFCDVDPVTWCIDPASVEGLLNERTKAVIAVDLYGGTADYSRLTALCGDSVALIEDAAEAVGSRCNGAPAGSFGTFATFSFHGSKTLTTGEGGMLVTDDEVLFDRVQRLRDHGRAPGDVRFLNEFVGHKYKMSAMQAALGRVQLARLPELVEAKRQIFSWYLDRLGAHGWLTLNAEPAGTFNSYWMTTILLDESLKAERDRIVETLAMRGVATRPFFHPLSNLPAYASSPDRERAERSNPVSRRLAQRGFNLPSALSLTEADVDYVCTELIHAVERIA